jgi:flagellar hook-associated protein 2
LSIPRLATKLASEGRKLQFSQVEIPGEKPMGISLNPAALLSGQGIDVSGLVQKILAQRSGPLTEWQQEQTTLSTQSGLLLGINNNLTALASAVNALVDPTGPLATLTGTSSQPGILTATAQTSAATGTHNIVVTNLATTSSYFSDPITTGSFLTPGSFTLQVGSGSPATITVNSGTTLDSLASYINSHAPSFGVTASVINDASGSRLSLGSNTTGAPGNLAIVGGASVGLTFHQVAGINASLTVDNVPISSPTNIVTGAIPGVTLNLISASPGTPVQITVGTDAAQVSQAITNFVSAYNTLVQSINAQFTVDPTTNTEGPLGSDSSLRSLQSSLLADVTSSITGNSGLINLATLGINLNNDGTLTINNTATANEPSFNDVLAANPGAVKNFFQNSSGLGFANNFSVDLNNLTDPTQGVLTSDLAQNGTQAKDLASSISNFQDQLAAEQTQLTLVYAQVNATLEAYPLLLQQVTETLGSLPSALTNTNSITGTSSPTLTSGL